MIVAYLGPLMAALLMLAYSARRTPQIAQTLLTIAAFLLGIQLVWAASVVLT